MIKINNILVFNWEKHLTGLMYNRVSVAYTFLYSLLNSTSKQNS